MRELNLNGTISRFEVAHKNHYHFSCENCGIVLDLDEPVDEGLNRKLAALMGLKILYHELEFCGLCADCQSNVSKQSTIKATLKR